MGTNFNLPWKIILFFSGKKYRILITNEITAVIMISFSFLHEPEILVFCNLTRKTAQYDDVQYL